MFKLTPKFVPKSGARLPSAPLAHTATQAPSPIIIADRGEFIDALARLRRGHVLVRPRTANDDDCAQCLLDHGIVYTAFAPLLRYGLISEYRNTQGFSNMRYYQLTDSGKRFADRARRAWRQRPLLERLAVRLMG